MGISSALLLVALFAAGAALAATRLRLPTSVVQLGLATAAAAGTTLVGLALVGGIRAPITVFGLTHMLYLCIVVGVPIVIGAWCLSGWKHGARGLAVVGSGCIAVALAGAGIYATHIEPNRLRVERVTLVSAKITSPLRVGVVADMQTPNVGDHERDAIAKLLATEPDLVVVPGDFFQGSPAAITANRQDFVDLLAAVVDGVELVVVVSGDSDSPAELQSIVREAGATFLNNTVVEATVRGVDLRLVGVDVPNQDLSFGGISRILATQSDRLTLLVSHRPDVVLRLGPEADVDLVLAGHTHGGQVAIPFIGPLVTFSDVPRSIGAGGLGEVDGVPIYVSTGVGLERRQAPQVRFGVRPSVGVINIVAG